MLSITVFFILCLNLYLLQYGDIHQLFCLLIFRFLYNTVKYLATYFSIDLFVSTFQNKQYFKLKRIHLLAFRLHIHFDLKSYVVCKFDIKEI